MAQEDEATRIATGGLASAFSAAVADAPPSEIAETVRVSNEWYVGINGVPVGPMKLGTLRSKSAQGIISPDSLVWREGFEEWLPLRTYPELVAIVEEGLSSARASLTPPVTASLPAQPGEVAIHTASQPDDPLAGVGAAGFGAPASGMAGVVTDADAGIASDFPAGMPRRGASPLAWIAVVVALAFGLTVGFVLFSKEPEKVIVEVPASGAASVALAPGATGVPGETGGEGPEVIEESNVTGGKGPRAAGGPVAKSGNSKGGPSKSGVSGLSGLSGLRGSGPSAGPGTPGAATGKGKLDAAALQRTVARYKGSVKRGCWQPALQTRDENAPSSARINVSITVSPSGSVTGARTSGDPKGYRGLASCISSRVRGWRFPTSGETTTVNVPFVFASQ